MVGHNPTHIDRTRSQERLQAPGVPSPTVLLVVAVLVAACTLAATQSATAAPFSNDKYVIDPSGKSLFTKAAPEYRQFPGPLRRRHDVYLMLNPNIVTAPVGSEVILVAGICGRDQKMSIGKRIEWSIETGSVGHLVDLQRHRTAAVFLTNYHRAKKISPTYALGSTSPEYVMLTRGTPTMEDDIPIEAGQTWISLTSPREGTTYLTAYAPDVYGWDSRKRSAVIEWVDAQWQFPPAATNPVGTMHTLTTTIGRHSDQTPIEDWIVRYEIIDGPEAGFEPDRVTVVEQRTNALGQASVNLVQTRQETGTNNIRVQIIRPADTSVGTSRRLVLATSMTQKVWTTPEISLVLRGPSQASIGSQLNFQAVVKNLGQLPVKDVVVSDPMPEGMEFVSSVPATALGRAPSWRLGDIPGGESRTIEITVRATGAGNLIQCVRAHSASNVSAENCVTTTVLKPSLDMQIIGPDQGILGDLLPFEVVITNRGEATATGLLLLNDFDPGLVHEMSTSPMETDLRPIPPGATERIQIVLRADRGGRLCQRIRLSGEGTVRAAEEKCTMIVAPAAPAISLRKWIPAQGDGPYTAQLGEKIKFQLEVTNNGPVAMPGLTLVEQYADELNPIMATPGYQFDERVNMIWRLGPVAPNQTVTYTVECDCRELAERSCNRAQVKDASGRVIAESEACVTIRPQQTSLELNITPTQPRLAVGKTTTCVITLTNHGPQAARGVEIAAELPDGIELDRAPFGPSRHHVNGRTIRFSPVVELAPGEVLTYRVPIRAHREGAVEIRARAWSAGSPSGTEAAQALLIEANS